MSSMLEKAHDVLQSVFGYSEFRPLQKDIISNILEGRDSLVIMPTGGGKSLCYQIPGLVFDGITLVVSPLISLMEDQVFQLQTAGVEARVLNSTLNKEQWIEVIQGLRNGNVRFLYLAPESLLKQSTLSILQELTISCIAIDEAHCISEWGHEFRPEYRLISKARENFPDAVCVALTATATSKVQRDIAASLNIQGADVFIAGFDRPNLFIEVREKERPLEQVLEIVDENPGESGIIYCFSRRQVDELCAELKSAGVTALPYHAGMSDKDRKRNQNLFVRDKVPVMVATIAFGMGIHKDNVRYVIHHDLPKSIESYYQQIGRAGRDGLDARCVLLFSKKDTRKIKYVIRNNNNSEQELQMLEDLVAFFEQDSQCRRIPLLAHFGEAPRSAVCDACDICNAGKSAAKDLTVQAQQFLSCLVRMKTAPSAQRVIDVLLAVKGLDAKYQDLSTFGIGNDFSREQWLHLSHQLVSRGFISHSGASIFADGQVRELFKGEIPFIGTLPRIKRKAVAKQVDFKRNEDVYIALKQLRTRLASEAGMPPYIIFSDKTLDALSREIPRSRTALLGVHGIGIKKADTYGSDIISVIENSLGSSAKPADAGKDTLELIAEDCEAGMLPGLIMEKYSLKRSSLLSSLETAVDRGHTIPYKWLSGFSGIPEEVFDCYVNDESTTDAITAVQKRIITIARVSSLIYQKN